MNILLEVFAHSPVKMDLHCEDLDSLLVKWMAYGARICQFASVSLLFCPYQILYARNLVNFYSERNVNHVNCRRN